MATIGTFTKSANGSFTGTIRTLALNVKAKIVPDQAKASEAAPDYRVFSGTVELGAGWQRTAKGGEQRDYVSLKLDDPILAVELMTSHLAHRHGFVQTASRGTRGPHSPS